MRLILASASPRRADLLTAAGYSFEIHAVHVDERSRRGERPASYVQRLAAEKSALALAELTSSATAGDDETGPAKSGREVRKGDGPTEAGHHAREADGPTRTGPYVRETDGPAQPRPYVEGAARELVVLAADTTVVVGDEILGKPRDVEDAGRMLRRLAGRTHQVLTGVSLRSEAADAAHVEVTSVLFAQLTEEQIAWYVASGEGRDKAGGYAIQGLAARFIPRIDGSYSNVVGLPIAAIDGLIRRLSWPPTVLASRE